VFELYLKKKPLGYKDPNSFIWSHFYEPNLKKYRYFHNNKLDSGRSRLNSFVIQFFLIFIIRR